MKSHLTNWVRGYATWAAIVLLLVAVFIALVANSIWLPLALICLAVGLIIFRYWDAINAFDLWDFDEWARTRAGSIGIREWHAPYHAAERFCDPAIVRARNEAAAEMNSIMMELIKDQGRHVSASIDALSFPPAERERARPARPGSAGRHADYEAAQARHDKHNLALANELLRQLAAGELVARGLPTRDDITQSERIIPASRWRIMRFDISKADATGRGFHYLGIVIGKKLGR